MLCRARRLSEYKRTCSSFYGRSSWRCSRLHSWSSNGRGSVPAHEPIRSTGWPARTTNGGREMAIEGAYSGLRVLDLGQGIAAPYCAMLLAMHGADVVKLEPPGGDWSRGLGKRYGDHTAMSAHFNRGKRGLALDLRAPAGRDIALDLAKRADIVIEGFRPGVAARLGLGYEALAALNPRLLYVSVSGFGQEGPHIALPCTDSVAQAFSGLAALN